MFTATLEVSGTSARFVTTHLESGANAHIARREQLKDELREDAYIVAGDLNLRTGEEFYVQNWRDAWVVAGQAADDRCTWDTGQNTRLHAQQSFLSKLRFRFDRMYMRTDKSIHISRFNLITNKVGGTHPSDHFALLAAVNLR